MSHISLSPAEALTVTDPWSSLNDTILLLHLVGREIFIWGRKKNTQWHFIIKTTPRLLKNCSLQANKKLICPLINICSVMLGVHRTKTSVSAVKVSREVTDEQVRLIDTFIYKAKLQFFKKTDRSSSSLIYFMFGHIQPEPLPHTLLKTQVPTVQLQ